jgi:hypothetical protein
MTFDLNKSSNKLLILLLLADLMFILIHVFHMMEFQPVKDPLFSVAQDFGYSEIYQYIKEYWIVVLLFMIAINRAHIIYFAWTVLYMYLLLDDSLEIHERLGRYLVKYFEIQPRFHLRAQDFGELSVSIFFGVLLFSFIGVAYLFSNGTAKRISKYLFILVMSVAFFGVIVDIIHTVMRWGRPIWELVEDGGEMLTMSIIVWYVFTLKFIPKCPGLEPKDAKAPSLS